MSDKFSDPQYNLLKNGPYITYADICKMYGVKSMDDAIKYALENTHEPISTIKRVINYSWRTYGVEESAITRNVINYYHAIIQAHWTKLYAEFIEKNTKIVIESLLNDRANLLDFLKQYMTKTFVLNSVKDYHKNVILVQGPSNRTHDELKEYIYLKLLESLNIKI